MKTYTVTLPIAGHITVEVQADNEKDAIEAAFDSPDLLLENVDDWEALRHFNRGNVCYCPSPWEAEATLVFGEEIDVDA